VELVLDAGVCSGEPSTVVDASGELLKLLRPGRLSWERILEETGGR
jgi:tRNA A37 threonylcarbamoyladenosine synthetase subunit TsaC/SUA5/YrdC